MYLSDVNINIIELPEFRGKNVSNKDYLIPMQYINSLPFKIKTLSTHFQKKIMPLIKREMSSIFQFRRHNGIRSIISNEVRVSIFVLVLKSKP